MPKYIWRSIRAQSYRPILPSLHALLDTVLPTNYQTTQPTSTVSMPRTLKQLLQSNNLVKTIHIYEATFYSGTTMIPSSLPTYVKIIVDIITKLNSLIFSDRSGILLTEKANQVLQRIPAWHAFFFIDRNSSRWLPMFTHHVCCQDKSLVLNCGRQTDRQMKSMNFNWQRITTLANAALKHLIITLNPQREREVLPGVVHLPISVYEDLSKVRHTQKALYHARCTQCTLINSGKLLFV